ncbi:MAG TPA: hypothetical protein VKC60_12385, partial [Opitutaceae bacterium]|nr:hypothetical protein [Opitutaceae bacterium]
GNVLVTDVAPRRYVGTTVGLISFLGGVTSIAFNGAAGWLVDHFGYTIPLMVGACLHPLGALVLAKFYNVSQQPSDQRPEVLRGGLPGVKPKIVS